MRSRDGRSDEHSKPSLRNGGRRIKSFRSIGTSEEFQSVEWDFWHSDRNRCWARHVLFHLHELLLHLAWPKSTELAHLVSSRCRENRSSAALLGCQSGGAGGVLAAETDVRDRWMSRSKAGSLLIVYQITAWPDSESPQPRNDC